jgi:hypothetical protein
VLHLLDVLSTWRFTVCVCVACIVLALALDASGNARVLGFLTAGLLVAFGAAWERRFSRIT